MGTETRTCGGWSADQKPTNRRARPLWKIVLIFVAVFAVEQTAWDAANGTFLERSVVHVGTVIPATAAVNLITPGVRAKAHGASIKASGGGLNILDGCEGTEVVFLLVAAFAAVQMTWQKKLLGMALGMGLVFVLNQGRILALFYAYRADRDLFDALHMTILPVVLVACVTLYFYAYLHRQRGALA